MSDDQTKVEDYQTVLRIHKIDPTLEGLDQALNKLANLEMHAENAVRGFFLTGIKPPVQVL